jgi:predicted HTH domain antitoxin
VEYLNGEISIGEMAEHLKKSIEDTMDWLNENGVQSSHLMSQDLEAIARKNMIDQLKERGFDFPGKE